VGKNGHDWFSSDTIECSTPQAFFDKLNDEFHFTLDVAASSENAKCSRFFTPNDDGLLQEWHGVVWCNPPYGRTISEWVKKAYKSAQNGTTVVMLLPSRTDPAWWHNWVMQASEVRFVRGRLKYDHRGGTRFANVVVIFRPRQLGKPSFSSMNR
jgi:phage N-6-adenine-methyltransferase